MTDMRAAPQRANEFRLGIYSGVLLKPTFIKNADDILKSESGACDIDKAIPCIPKHEVQKVNSSAGDIQFASI